MAFEKPGAKRTEPRNILELAHVDTGPFPPREQLEASRAVAKAIRKASVAENPAVTPTTG